MLGLFFSSETLFLKNPVILVNNKILGYPFVH